MLNLIINKGREQHIHSSEHITQNMLACYIYIYIYIGLYTKNNKKKTCNLKETKIYLL